MYTSTLRKSRGYAFITEPGERTKECDTFTCSHCNHIVHVGKQIGVEDLNVSMCTPCGKMICGNCTKVGKCIPFEKVLEQVESRYRFLRSAGLL